MKQGYESKTLKLLVGRVLGETTALASAVIRFNEHMLITYGELADAIQFPRGSDFQVAIGNMLGSLGDALNEVKIDGMVPPPIQALVVNKATGIPGMGLGRFIPDYEHMDNIERLAAVAPKWNDITAFGRKWLDVLAVLGIN